MARPHPEFSHSESQGVSAQAFENLSAQEKRALLERLLKEKAERAKQFGMSYGQQGLWHAYRRNPQATPFNVFLPVRIRSLLNLKAMEQAVQLVVKRHPSLRTVFSDRNAELVQKVQDDLTPEFTVIALDGADDRQARQCVVGETLRPFDLERGPLLRIIAFRLAEDDWIILALTHHIIVDFWSLILILDEVREAYPRFAVGEEPNFPSPVSNYSIFVREQQELMASPQGFMLRDYWKSIVEQGNPVLDLPVDFVRPSQFTGRAESVGIEIPDDLVIQVTQLSAELRVTAYAVFHAAFQVFLWQHTRQESFFIGSPFSGRRHQKFEKTVGFFVNMLPILARVDGRESFAQLVAKAAQMLIQALEHEAYPISEIVSNAGLVRDSSRSPLFQVSCTFEKSQLQHESGRAGFLFPDANQVWEFGGLRQESFYIPHQTCHYDLEAVLEQHSHGFRGMFVYCKDLFSEATAQQFSKNFTELFKNLLSHAHQPLNKIAWAAQERQEYLAPEETLGSMSHTGTATVSSMVRSTAAKSSLQIALKDRTATWTYGQMMSRASILASSLRAAGVQRDDLVPIVFDLGPNAIIAALAVHMSGAAFVPIDPQQPSVEFASLVSDTACKCVVGSRVDPWLENFSAEKILELPEEQVSVEDWAGQRAYDDHSQPASLAYGIYTSGSTGKPKGVLVEHRAVCNTLAWRQKDVPLDGSERVLMLLSHQFDAGLGVAWTALTQGATLVWVDPPARSDPSLLVEQIQRDEITVLTAVPSLVRLVANHPGFGSCKSLRSIWMGGESTPSDLPQLIRERLNVQVWNFYGPTEAAIEATACNLTAHPPEMVAPIGKPISNVEVLIVDESVRPLPDTVPGEIAIGGVGLARCYLNDPELTAKRFVPHPNRKDARVYLTGDRGRRCPDGSIQFLGRIDDQIKLRGYRIELGEIESHLESHYMVRRAAVKLLHANSPQAQLVAFVSLADELRSQLTNDPAVAVTLRRYLRDKLPNYKVPAAIDVVKSMPMTSSGKIDRKRLPDHLEASSLSVERVAPVNALESYLVSVWCELLATEKVGTNQNFFDAGGSSLLAAMVTSRLTQELGFEVPTALIFDLADISQLAQRLAQLHPREISERFGQDCIATRGIAELQSVEHPLLAALKPNGSRVPVFMVHPPGGIVLCYRDLSQQLAVSQPLFALRSRGLHGTEDLPTSIEDMARDYLTAVRSVQPNGPYRLGGWSLGGLVAYEMAQQLIECTQSVELILLDTTIPEGATTVVPADEQVSVGREYGIDLSLDQLGALDPTEQLQFLWEHANNLGVVQNDSPQEVVEKTLRDLQRLFHHHVELSRQYRLTPTDARIVLIRPRDIPFELEVAEDRGWRHLSREVRVHFVSGHHHSMVQMPHVLEIARILSQ